MLIQHSHPCTREEASPRERLCSRAILIWHCGHFFSFQAAVSAEQQVIFDEINQEGPMTTANP